MSAWAAIITGVIGAGSAIGQQVAKSSSISEAQEESRMLSGIMERISKLQRYKQELGQQGQLREAREFETEQNRKTEDAITQQKRMDSYRMNKTDMNDILGRLNNNSQLRERTVQNIIQRRTA